MSGRHRKPPGKAYLRLTVAAAGSITALPLTAGTANALAWSDVSGILAMCESGNRPTASNPRSTASGTWQLLDSTWRYMGGTQYSRRAKDATPAQQELVAKRLFLRAGLTPWNASRSCWRHRIGKAAPKRVVPAPSERVYRVQAGDTLSDIAARTGHTWQDLWAENKATIADPARISVGLSINLL